MGRPLVLSYVFTLLCLLLGAPFLLYKVGRRIRGSALPMAHGVMLGIGVETLFSFLSLALLLSAADVRLPMPAGLFALAAAGAAWAVAVEGLRALLLGQVSTRVRDPRSATHFGLGWGCGVAAFKGALLLAALLRFLYEDLEQVLEALPAGDREGPRAALEQQRTLLLQASPLRPPLEHVLQYGLDAFFHVAFTLLVIRIWTRGERGAWLKAAGWHAALTSVTRTMVIALPGWGGLLSSLLLQLASVGPAYRWVARQIVRPEA